MKNRIIKKLTAAVMAFTLTGVAVSVPVDSNNIFNSILTANAKSMYDDMFDEDTGVLTLSGYIDKDEIRNFRKKAQVTSVVVDGEHETVLPKNCWGLFMGYSNVVSIDLSGAKSHLVEDINYMFNCCRNLSSVNLSGFNTSKVTTMYRVFGDCDNLESIDVSSFDTSEVTHFYATFQGCDKLKSINLSSFDTSNAVDMTSLFSDCSSLESLDISNFTTSKVAIMNQMFCGCSSLTDLDLGNFDTSSAVDMDGMFWHCSSLKEIDLSNFDTSRVTDMCGMFSGCNNLSKIYVGSGWSTESAERYEMFDGCKKLVGGAGTKYDANHVGIEYAHVDGGKDDPGYLTFKGNDFFKTQNLILSGQIGVSFNLDLSSLTEQERNASYMEFKVNGRTSKVPFDKNSKNASGKYYSFTCYVTSVEMADTITATFHYGNGKTVSKKYSVLDYINAIEKNASSFDNKTLYLIRSIADYGHYSQPFLAASNNWTIGKEHKEMSKHYTGSYSYDDIKKAAGKYQRVLDLGKSDIEKITYSLSLNSGTSLNVFIKAKDNYKGSVKVTTKKGNTVMSYTAVKQADGRYKVTIPDISAHQLGDIYTITAETTNGTATCSLSALSYVYAILDGSSNNTSKNAVSSLYIYYDATLNYRSKA